MEKKLYRKDDDKMLGGVSSGLADYLSMDVSLVRLIFVLMAFFGLSGVLIYIVLWIILPVENAPDAGRIYEDKARGKTPSSKKKNKSNSRLIIGLILIGLGVYFLLHEFHCIPYWFNMGRLWPLVFIVVGMLILSNIRKKKYPLDEQEEKPTAPDTTKASDSNSDTPVI